MSTVPYELTLKNRPAFRWKRCKDSFSIESYLTCRPIGKRSSASRIPSAVLHLQYRAFWHGRPFKQCRPSPSKAPLTDVPYHFFLTWLRPWISTCVPIVLAFYILPSKHWRIQGGPIRPWPLPKPQKGGQHVFWPPPPKLMKLIWTSASSRSNTFTLCVQW